MNLGTSFLVAPIFISKPEVKQNVDKTKEFLMSKNEAYLKAMNPDDQEDEGGRASTLSKAKPKEMKKKKSPS